MNRLKALCGLGAMLLLVLGTAAGCSDSPGTSGKEVRSAPATPREAKSGETARHAADRLLRELIRGGWASDEPRPYDASATAGVPKPMLKDYYPPVPGVEWIIKNDLLVRRGALFESMQPAKVRDDLCCVPILQDGRPVSEFDMSREGRQWEAGSWLSEGRPGGFFYSIDRAEADLRSVLGQEAETRVALLLPSGLVFVIGNNGDEEGAVYLAFVNEGPGLKGYDAYLPTTDAVLSHSQLRELLAKGER